MKYVLVRYLLECATMAKLPDEKAIKKAVQNRLRNGTTMKNGLVRTILEQVAFCADGKTWRSVGKKFEEQPTLF